eukprot:9493033-Pyramimonas_sp.AAC.4
MGYLNFRVIRWLNKVSTVNSKSVLQCPCRALLSSESPGCTQLALRGFHRWRPAWQIWLRRTRVRANMKRASPCCSRNYGQLQKVQEVTFIHVLSQCGEVYPMQCRQYVVSSGFVLALLHSRTASPLCPYLLIQGFSAQPTKSYTTNPRAACATPYVHAPRRPCRIDR